MTSHTTERFRQELKQLPQHVQRQARQAYRLFKQNPYHPSLHFKQVHPARPIYAVRISVDYRAVGVREEDVVIWFWIGVHADYEKLISRL
jgi:mRNA-degrading endonuclease RelE of RelBE toxin-antitoxin system